MALPTAHKPQDPPPADSQNPEGVAWFERKIRELDVHLKALRAKRVALEEESILLREESQWNPEATTEVEAIQRRLEALKGPDLTIDDAPADYDPWGLYQWGLRADFERVVDWALAEGHVTEEDAANLCLGWDWIKETVPGITDRANCAARVLANRPAQTEPDPAIPPISKLPPPPGYEADLCSWAARHGLISATEERIVELSRGRVFHSMS